MYDEEDFLMLSGLQHFAFCRRQWALIHLEEQWIENVHTAEGRLFHKNAHDASKLEKRGNTIITRGLHIQSRELGLTGICDVVEFHQHKDGIKLYNFDGLWLPYPIEYKKGEPKESDEDILQLCAEAMCLEEILVCNIPEGSMFYGKTRRRVQVEFTKELRDDVKKYTSEMHQYWQRGYTPKVKKQKGCNSCSLKDVCLPQLNKTISVETYIDEMLGMGE